MYTPHRKKLKRSL